eukprot:298344-Pelagomonas_calceolata.AAC.7
MAHQKDCKRWAVQMLIPVCLQHLTASAVWHHREGTERHTKCTNLKHHKGKELRTPHVAYKAIRSWPQEAMSAKTQLNTSSCNVQAWSCVTSPLLLNNHDAPSRRKGRH